MTPQLHRYLLYLILITIGLLSACERGPTPDRLEQDLQTRLDTHFQEDLFSVQGFRRKGSAPFRDLERDISGVYTYYDAELRFQQDYKLSDWRDLNLGTLAYAIGATESGIEGFSTKGNRSGDTLFVHGRFAYQERDDAWIPLDEESGPRPLHQPEPAAESHGRSPESVLEDARAFLTKTEKAGSDKQQTIIVEELDAAVHRIDLRTARFNGKVTLGSGSPPGTYYSFGEALSNYSETQGIAMFSAISEGSVENASRLQAGRIDFGLVQSDVAQLLHQGLTSEGFYPNRELRAVASLWPEAVHLLTLEGTGVRSLSDLRGRQVAIGQRGSGSRVNALLIGLAARLDEHQVPAVREISLARAITQLEAGEIDALFLTEAIPAPSIQALAARRNDLRFIPMPLELFETLAEKRLVYYPLTVPARTYPGQTEAFTTLGLAAALMTHSRVPDERVQEMLELLLTGGDELARKYYRAAFISRETMRLGLAVPLHPGAESFYDRYDLEQDQVQEQEQEQEENTD
mgnify:FL=1